MADNQQPIKGIKIAYIGGGSQNWARILMNDLALEGSISGTVSLYDINHEAALQNEKLGNLISKLPEAKGKWKYEAIESLPEALTGADFVIISILPGTFEDMKSDVHVPEKYGIYQSVGDTVGPGGFMRALRAIPLYVEFAKNIEKYSPDAWVINYTNPMTLCMRALYKAFPKIKAFGCCHEVFHTQALLKDMLKEMYGVDIVKRDEMKVNVLGINHFTWLDKASYKGMNVMPLYERFVDKHYEDGFIPKEGEWWKTSYFSSAERVKFDLFKKYGLIAAAGDRHLAEFMPPWYLKDPGTVEEWKFHLTPVEYRMEKQKEKVRENKEILAGEQQLEIAHSSEEGVRMIKALLGLEDLITNVNMPNQGQIPNLPIDAVVETNAVFRRDSVQPIVSGTLPLDIHNMVQRHVINQEGILQAVLSKDAKLACNVFLNEPLLSELDRKDGEALFHEMIENMKLYLLGWDIQCKEDEKCLLH